MINNHNEWRRGSSFLDKLQVGRGNCARSALTFGSPLFQGGNEVARAAGGRGVVGRGEGAPAPRLRRVHRADQREGDYVEGGEELRREHPEEDAAEADGGPPRNDQVAAADSQRPVCWNSRQFRRPRTVATLPHDSRDKGPGVVWVMLGKISWKCFCELLRLIRTRFWWLWFRLLMYSLCNCVVLHNLVCMERFSNFFIIIIVITTHVCVCTTLRTCIIIIIEQKLFKHFLLMHRALFLITRNVCKCCS